ncbi:MAG: hypothetical protein HY245_02735 [Rhizobiales bacterium]|nr:hypothetical protein [Hyphomicrobiales bacterium]MBI3672343.1 hypothetical protein [Hyphomicrobiales bacterium]
MPLQNRVNPWGGIEAVAARGTMLGNRGGKFHRPDRTLGTRRWASHHWICCELGYKGLHHEPMGGGYTSLFFLDEVTALAAGHRPCFYCRRAAARAFLGNRRVNEFDAVLHGERTALRPESAIGALPDAAMVEIDGAAWAVRRGFLLRWSHSGYTAAIECGPAVRGRLLTPLSIAAILRLGYQPRWHVSALTGEWA